MSNSNKKDKFLYLLFISELNVCKIGISNNIDKRIKQLQTGCPYRIDLVKAHKTEMASKIEKIMHRKYSPKKVDYNEYSLVGEWFYIDIGDVLSFESTCREIEGTITGLREMGNPFV